MMWIALEGLGGSGKTSVLNQLGFGTYTQTPVVRPRGLSAIKGGLLPCLPLLYVLHSWYDFLMNSKTLTDRCYLDRFVSLAVHKRLPVWYLKLFVDLVPKPDYVVHICITPEEAYKRKHEHELDFIREEQQILHQFLYQWLPTERIIKIDGMKNDEIGVANIVRKVIDSYERYGDPWARFIFEKDYTILELNKQQLFDICWMNRMVFHYFDYDEDIDNMYLEFACGKQKTIDRIKKKYPKAIILEKAVYADIESDVDVLYDGDFDVGDTPLEIDLHRELNYFGYKFDDPSKIGYFHALFETGTCIMRDYDSKPYWCNTFGWKHFPKKLQYPSSVWIQMNFTGAQLMNYIRVWRAWRKGKLPYYEPKFSKQEIWKMIK